MTPRAGWYPDPAAGDDSDGRDYRWWDGTQWADDVCRPEPPRRSYWRGMAITLTVVAIGVVGVAIAMAVWFSMAVRSAGNK